MLSVLGAGAHSTRAGVQVCVCACVSVPAYCIFIYSQSVSQVGRTQKPRPHNVPVAARWRRRKDSSAHLTFCHSNENCTSSSSSTFHAHTHTQRHSRMLAVINSSTTHTHSDVATPALIALFSIFLTIFLSLHLLHCIHLGATFSLVLVCVPSRCCPLLLPLPPPSTGTAAAAWHRKIYNAIEYANIAYLSCRQIQRARSRSPSPSLFLSCTRTSHTLCCSMLAHVSVCVPVYLLLLACVSLLLQFSKLK